MEVVMFHLGPALRNVFCPAAPKSDDLSDIKRMAPLSLAELMAASSFADTGGLSPEWFRYCTLEDDSPHNCHSGSPKCSDVSMTEYSTPKAS
jgi:hypothetical protein